jgi:hypothetical protein
MGAYGSYELVESRSHIKPSAEIAARLLKRIKPYIVKRANGGCQVLFPLSKLDDIADAATSHIG